MSIAIADYRSPDKTKAPVQKIFTPEPALFLLFV